MAAGTRLRIALALAVLLAHLAVLDEFARALQWGSALEERVDPMFTRVIRPEPPPQPPRAVARAEPAKPPPEPSRARATRLPASAPKAAPEPGAEAVVEPPQELAQAVPESATPADTVTASETAISADTATGTQAAQAPAEPAASAASASASASAASAPEGAASAASTPPAPTWPTDTRLSYRVSGIFREGQLYGDAQVQWQRENADYQVRVEIDITLWAHLVMTSQGIATGQGLVPRVYEETRRGKRRAVQFGERAVFLDNGRVAPRPESVQDTASQFVELAWRFATGRDVLDVGRTVSFWMARPGAVDYWTYDIVGRDVLRTRLGDIDAFHLKPRPIANPRGNITAEMWFAPGLQYLPVRIKVSMGEAYVDLLVEKVEQR